MDTVNSMRQQTVEMLRRFAPAFAPDEDNIPAIADAARWLCVPGGSTLFEKGEPSDTIYFVLSGLLGVWIGPGDSTEKMVRRLGPGEMLGEMGCITGEPRSATVRALRSTELIAIAWADIERIATKDPAILLSFCRTVIQRLVQSEQGRTPTFRPRSFALASAGEGIDLRAVGERFKEALGQIGRTFLVTRAECQNMTGDQLFQLETTHEHIIYVAEQDNPAWSKLCLGQADTILMVAKGEGSPTTKADPKDLVRPGIPSALILVWDRDIQPAKTAQWIKAIGAQRHFHVRGASDMRRMSRLLTGRAFGLVLSGGGARGLAHIGIARALKENGIDIDLVMGTSIGALIGAGVALEWDTPHLLERAHQFCRANQLFEITIPRLSLLAGRNVRGSLLRWFGDLQIEDTPIPYSCVSTNLNEAKVAVHQAGSLQLWIRASAAVPGVFPPVVVGDIVHVDGGVLNNMPSDLIRDSGAGFVLGADVGAGAVPPEVEAAANVAVSQAEASAPTLTPDAACVLSPRMPLNILELLIRVGCLGDEARWGLRRKQCDVLIVPPLSSYGLLNFKAYQQIIEIGYRAALQNLPLILAKKEASPASQHGGHALVG
jgi:NTE family protein